MARRLAAILAADVVGYSRLMEVDEAGTLVALRAHREQLLDPTISEHSGRIVKLMGDGVLAEFGSVVDAVACALAIQEGMSGRNEDVPEDRRIVLRIGVHLGDVMVEDDDIYGDGVNVAARLEGLADPGGICISQQALDQVETKLQLALEDMGKQQLKNIARPVGVWRVEREGAPRRKPSRPPQGIRIGRLAVAAAVVIFVAVGAIVAFWPDPTPPVAPVCSLDETASLRDRPSIAVLPFDNMDGDAGQDYFGYGIAEDLITDLSKVCGLLVIPSDISFPYAGEQMSVEQVASELGVRYLVNGNVRREGGRVRITAKLIDAISAGQVWADRYDRDYENIFSLLDDVLDKVVGSLALELSEYERKRLAFHGTRSVAAHDLYMQARRPESTFTCEGHREAMALYEQALSIDPDYAVVYARMANILELNTRFQCSDDIPADLRKAVKLAEKAAELDPQDPNIWWSLGRATARLGTPEALKRGVEALQWAIELDPYFADAYAYLGVLYTGAGRAEDGLRSVETAMRLNPRYPFWYLVMRGFAGFCSADYESAVADYEAARERSPTAPFVRWLLAAAYAKAGQVGDAEWEVEELIASGFDGTIATITETQPMQDPECLTHYREGLRIAGVPE